MHCIPEENTGGIQKHGNGDGSKQSTTDTQTKDCKHHAAEGNERTRLPEFQIRQKLVEYLLSKTLF